MDILTKEEFLVKFEDISSLISDGSVFVHPTDTIYGIGCDATNKDAVRKVRDIKDSKQPFSVIAPGKSWIFENCIVHDHAKEFIDKLPGPYTLIFKLKNKEAVSSNVNFNFDTIGVRIPDHWFSEAVEKLGKPIVTTSANKHGEEFMTSVDNMHPHVSENVDFIVYEDEKHGRPSKIVDLSYEEAVVHLR